jgi:hypothetical protein
VLQVETHGFRWNGNRDQGGRQERQQTKTERQQELNQQAPHKRILYPQSGLFIFLQANCTDWKEKAVLNLISVIKSTNGNQKQEHAMAKRKNQKPSEKADKELKALYAKMRKEFTAADLQKYTVIEKGVPLEKVISQMQKVHQQHKPKN